MADVEIRPYADRDEAAVLAVLHSSLGKTVDDRYRDFFHWKHDRNPFGPSFMWVAETEGRLAGFRAFLRWRFVGPTGQPVEAVRAVDTATHPDFQGRGIFRTLTMHALDEMRGAGIELVFNTPNDNSRPGYLKMGWEIDGRVPVQVRPRSPLAAWRMARAKTAADNWSLPIEVGAPLDAFDDVLASALPALVRGHLVTDRSAQHLRWRYGGCPAIASRAVRAGAGAVLVRFRRRGAAVECTVGDVVGVVRPREAGVAVRRAMREGCADYAIATTATPVGGMLPVPRLGPIQTRRAVSRDPSRLPLALSLGDLEMF
ncbi:MAG: GNAT family N-acetyltransferase [Acidimicrobiales bacterium]